MIVKRINILYGGVQYSVGNRDLLEFQAEIVDAIKSGEPHWLRVNHGEGSYQIADLLLTSGVALTVMGIDPSDPDRS